MKIIDELQKTIAIEVTTKLEFNSKIDLEFLRKILFNFQYEFSEVVFIDKKKSSDNEILIDYWDLFDEYPYSVQTKEKFKTLLKNNKIDLRKKYEWEVKLVDTNDEFDIVINYENKKNILSIYGTCSLDFYGDLLERLTDI
ncbi:MAG: hypothetical protein IJ842_01310, partial [Bacilli bacterium]|nr:hypothetical protein [Bacilli bacterium]